MSGAKRKSSIADQMAMLRLMAVRRQPGLLEPGNIDIYNRPIVQNQDGSYSTVASMSAGDERGREVLVPTVVNGRVVSQSDAWNNYLQTGQHLGIFSNWRDAEEYAKALHQQQEWFYGRGR